MTVSATITDDKAGVKEVHLYYSTDGGNSWIETLMSESDDSSFEASIPSQSEGTTVQYYIKALDNALN